MVILERASTGLSKTYNRTGFILVNKRVRTWGYNDTRHAWLTAWMGRSSTGKDDREEGTVDRTRGAKMSD